MINRLVEQVIRENHYIRRALRSTYAHVFLDEFQDTTYPQFDLLSTAFLGSGAVLTAVGDRKQCIMGWAGAMEDSFAEFELTFGARPIELLSNWRSHAGLVGIQHAIAQAIDPATAAPNARSERTVNGDISAVWMFASPDDETSGLAAWFAQEIEGGLLPQDCVILVRNRADLVEAQLADCFLEHGVRIRNVARMVGEIAVQDVLEEALTQIVVPLLRLGASSSDPRSWDLVFVSLQRLHGIAEDDEQAQERLQLGLQEFVRSLRSMMSTLPPSEESVTAMYEMVITFLSRELLRNASPSYRRQQDFERVDDGVKTLLRESVLDATVWLEVLDQFEGVDQLPLMTIHKSKGLEFHTVVFHGLDDRTWWSLTADRPEELRAFFVAFTRAKQRAFFTLCHSRGRAVGWVDRLLSAAGVGRIDGPR
jgi:superfamily I DNA/RNA helicase